MRRHIFLVILFFTILSTNAQDDNNILGLKNLGFFEADSSFGNFDGGMGQLSVVVTKYSFTRENNTINISGIVSDKNGETFCYILASIAHVYENKLVIEKTYKIDCSGKFDVYFNIAPNKNIYFYTLGYSLLECSLDTIKIK